MANLRRFSPCVVAAVALIVPTTTFAQQRILVPKDFEFRHNPTSQAGSWDIYARSAGKLGGSILLTDHASPPDGVIAEGVIFDNNGDIREFFLLYLKGIDATGMTMQLDRTDVSGDVAAQTAYRDYMFYNSAVFPDSTDRRLSAISQAQISATVAKKTTDTFRLPPPPTVYDMQLGLLLPEAKVRLTASGATVSAALLVIDASR